MKINFSPPDITQREIDAVVEVLKSGWITTGPKTKQFEREIADYTDAAGAVCVNSATIGMELVLRYLGIGPGDEVITSAYTYTASASVIDHVGAKVVLADCQKDSFLIDYDDVAAKITERTKAIIPVNIAGVMADSAKLIQIAEGKRHLFQPKGEIQAKFGRIIILSDSAHSFGSTCNGEKSGSIADFSCFSFHAVKTLPLLKGEPSPGSGGRIWTTTKSTRNLCSGLSMGRTRTPWPKLSPVPGNMTSSTPAIRGI